MTSNTLSALPNFLASYDSWLVPITDYAVYAKEFVALLEDEFYAKSFSDSVKVFLTLE